MRSYFSSNSLICYLLLNNADSRHRSIPYYVRGLLYVICYMDMHWGGDCKRQAAHIQMGPGVYSDGQYRLLSIPNTLSCVVLGPASRLDTSNPTLQSHCQPLYFFHSLLRTWYNSSRSHICCEVLGCPQISLQTVGLFYYYTLNNNADSQPRSTTTMLEECYMLYGHAREAGCKMQELHIYVSPGVYGDVQYNSLFFILSTLSCVLGPASRHDTSNPTPHPVYDLFHSVRR